MNLPRERTPDERALNTTLAHALTLSITVILIVGLVIATTGFFQSEREQVATQELETIGNRIASDAMQATSLADRGGATNITTEHPETVAGSAYSAKVLTGGDCETGANTCIQLQTVELDVSVVVPVYNETGFEISAGNEGAFTVTTTGSGSVTSTSAPSRVSDIGVTSEVGVGSGINQISSVSLTQPGNQQPAANFEFTPATPHAGTSVEFNASASNDPDGVIKEYRWDFDGDGNFEETTTSPTLSKSLTAGRHNVTLEVWDGTARGNTSQSIDASGLAYLRDLDTISSDDSATFTVRNDFSTEITLQQLLIDPADDSITELNEETTDHEVEIGGSSLDDHWIEYDNGLSLDAGGEFVDFKYGGTSRAADEYVELNSGETATFDFQYFDKAVTDETMTFGLKYQYGSDDTVTNTTVFTDVVGGPDISNYQVTASGPDGQNIDVSFESSQQLTDIEAQLSGDVSGTLDEFDFTETNPSPGTYSYTADVSDGSDGTFTVELTRAESGSTASGDTPLSDTAYAGVTTGVLWQTAGDWDGGTVGGGSVVHADFGDHSEDRVELGYTRNGNGLVGYWPLDDPTGSTAPDESGTGNDGTIVGNPGEVNGLGGSTSYVLEPDDGTDEYVEIPDSPSLEMSDDEQVTVSLWVNKEDAQSSWVALFQHSDQSYNLQFENGNEPNLAIYADGEYTFGEVKNGVGNDEWAHLVGTFDRGDLALYRDGSQIDSNCQRAGNSPSSACKNNGISSASDPAGIGENIDTNSGGDSRQLDGKIDEVRVYNRALSDAEVKDLYETFVESTFTTTSKTATTAIPAEDLHLQYDVGTNAQTSIEARVITGNGDTSDWIQLSDGSSEVEVSGISTDSDTFQVEVRLSTSSVTESPVVNKVGVVEG